MGNYYLDGPRYASFDARPIAERIIKGEQTAVDTAFNAFYFAQPAQPQIDVIVRNDEGRTQRVMSLHRRPGMTDPAVWMDDELTEPTK